MRLASFGLLARVASVRMASVSAVAAAATPAAAASTAGSVAEAPNVAEIAENYRHIVARMEAARAAAGRARPVELVAVSKFKSAAHVQALYDQGHRVFGENYVQELVDKAEQLPGDIRWHMIGSLQSNKVKALLKVPGLAQIESVNSEKLARTLNREAAALGRPVLGVLVQVNTSGEDTKSGVEPSDVVALARFIVSQCPALRFEGLMTIGNPDAIASEDQPDFVRLAALLADVQRELGLDRDALTLSMGMSADFEAAIRFGSDAVRVGSSIFGARAKH
eukprot:Amastigsp_a177873_35.p1 type:complete len:279 gc:universal Amastigsp_a177873_35:86-922(+)